MFYKRYLSKIYFYLSHYLSLRSFGGVTVICENTKLWLSRIDEKADKTKKKWKIFVATVTLFNGSHWKIFGGGKHNREKYWKNSYIFLCCTSRQSLLSSVLPDSNGTVRCSFYSLGCCHFQSLSSIQSSLTLHSHLLVLKIWPSTHLKLQDRLWFEPFPSLDMIPSRTQGHLRPLLLLLIIIKIIMTMVLKYLLMNIAVLLSFASALGKLSSMSISLHLHILFLFQYIHHS